MAMEKICADKGTSGRLGPVPRSVTSDCGIAWCADPEDRSLFETGRIFPSLRASMKFSLTIHRFPAMRRGCGFVLPLEKITDSQGLKELV